MNIHPTCLRRPTRLSPLLLLSVFTFLGLLPNCIVAQGPVTLPIEVIGPDGYTRAVTFALDKPAGVNTLYLKTHRLAYRDASTNPDRGAKGSVRLNGGDWVDLDNSTVDCYDHEAAYGCLSGAYHTVRFTLPVTGAVAGENELEFRFNGTDGFSSGYRVLEFNLRKQAKGADRLPAGTFVQDDPAGWQPPRSDAQAIAAGKELWEAAELREFPGGEMIKAACASCHAHDGRDLEYYAFSNWSIQERSKYHGLSQVEGEQVASYIRSLGIAQGVQRLGRPWNPPYQPGPDLDSRPVEAWSAGAGLEWVLEKDADMVLHAFGGAVTEKNVRKVLDIEQTQNARETALAIQLPDWQEWLPEVHPVDAPRIGEEKFYRTPAMHDEAFYDTYVRTRELLDNNEVSALATDGRLRRQMNQLAEQLTNMNGRMKKAIGYSSTPGGSAGEDREGAVDPLVKWGAVKTWEIMQEYELDEQAPALYGEYGEARSWLSSRRNVFEIAPHRTANNHSHLLHQSVLVGKYFSTAWYHLQLIINGGNRATLKLWPVDWNYQPDHIVGLYSRGDGPRQPYRYVISHAKMLQQYHDGRPVEESGIGFRQIHPGRYAPIPGRRGTIFEGLAPEVRAELFGGLLGATMDLIEAHSLSEWPRDTLDKHDNTLRPKDYVPQLISAGKFNGHQHKGHHADIWYSMIPYFEEAGVTPQVLDRVIDWGQRMWPRGDWESLRPAPTLAAGTYQLLARHSGRALALDLDQKTNGGYDDPVADGANVFQYGTTRTSDRLWEIAVTGGGHYKITNLASRKALALDLPNGGRSANHNVVQYGTEGPDHCLWKIEEVAEGYYKLTNKYSGSVLEVGDASPEDGTNVRSGNYLSEPHQEWELVFIEATTTSTVSDDQWARAFELYPNPVVDELTIATGEDYRVALYDVAGRTVLAPRFYRGTTRLPLRDLLPGVYILTLYGREERAFRRRIVVN